MKLRILGNSIRVRLTRKEVDRLASQRRVEEITELGPSERLVYRIESSADAERPTASFAGGTIAVAIPSVLVNEWARTEQVGIRGEQPTGNGGLLRILVEKDFACLTPRQGEDDTDAYANPNQSC